MNTIRYKHKNNFNIDCGFNVNIGNVTNAIEKTNNILESFPIVLYKTIDFKTSSSIIGAIFCEALAKATGAIVNPIESGYPDILPSHAIDANETQLSNFNGGLEIKVTIGAVTKGKKLKFGDKRLSDLTEIAWKSHHRNVKELMGIVWDFHEVGKGVLPAITGIFHCNNLIHTDWTNVSGYNKRSTNVCNLSKSGKRKMGDGWVSLIDCDNYSDKYSKLLYTHIEKKNTITLEDWF